jgi:tight adherence protein B
VRATGDLTPGDIQASLGGRLAFVGSVQRIGASRPLDLILAFDTSGSMRGAPLEQAQAAGERLLDSVGRSGKVGLVVFNHEATVLQPLTADADAVRAALETLPSGQGTALYDGVTAAVRAAGSDSSARRVVVVLSDGADTTSKASIAQARRLALASGVEIDAVGLTSSSSFVAAPLRHLASVTGGKLVQSGSAADLEPMAVQLAQRSTSSCRAPQRAVSA